MQRHEAGGQSNADRIEERGSERAAVFINSHKAHGELADDPVAQDLRFEQNKIRGRPVRREFGVTFLDQTMRQINPEKPRGPEKCPAIERLCSVR